MPAWRPSSTATRADSIRIAADVHRSGARRHRPRRRSLRARTTSPASRSTRSLALAGSTVRAPGGRRVPRFGVDVPGRPRRGAHGGRLRRQLRRPRDRPGRRGRRHARARAVARPDERVQGHGPAVHAAVLLRSGLDAARTRAQPLDDYLILVATSGDTGKAALEGFADRDHTSIAVFYPARRRERHPAQADGDPARRQRRGVRRARQLRRLPDGGEGGVRRRGLRR